MNCKRTLVLFATLIVLLLSTSQVTGQQDVPWSPQRTYGYAFTYQGQLKDAGGPVNDTCDLRFVLWDAASGGSQVGNTLTLEGVEIEDGLFTARLDFGGGVHSGAARWLAVAVRCPAGSGGYVTLEPRQELTGAPAALSLALPFTAEANIGGPLVWFENDGDGEAAGFSSAQGFALWVDSAGLDGLYVASAGQDGVHVISAGGRGLAVETAGGDGVFVNTAHNNGVKVNSADYNGLQVDSTGGDGVYVGSAGDDGVFVGAAGNPSATMADEMSNGLEVAGAEGHGLFVGRADGYGVIVESANDSGVYIGSAGSSGLSVGSAGASGLEINSADHDGVYVHRAGNASAATLNMQPNGFEVAGAQGYGLYVGRADLDGVYVNSTAWHGVNVHGAGVNGVYVTNAGNYGVAVASAGAGGVYGHSANGPGVRGESESNDGVVGWTGSGSKSGVFGYSQTGNGVAGISDGQYGVLAITTSGDPNEAALLAHSQGAGPAVEARGDLVVTGAYRGNIGPNGGASFPRPAYNSGWVALDYAESMILTHNIGGNPEDYVIDMTRRCAYTGITNYGDGNDWADDTGYVWAQLNSATISVYRGSNDRSCGAYPMQFRVRIWVYR